MLLRRFMTVPSLLRPPSGVLCRGSGATKGRQNKTSRKRYQYTGLELSTIQDRLTWRSPNWTRMFRTLTSSIILQAWWRRQRCYWGRRGSLLSPRNDGSSSIDFRGKCLDLVCSLYVQKNVQTAFSSLTAALNLISLMSLQLSKSIPQVIETALICCLKLFEDERRSGIPLLANFFCSGHGASQLIGTFRALLPGLFYLLLGCLVVLGQSCKVTLNTRQGRQFPVFGVVLSQWTFYVLLDLVGEGFVRRGN